MRDGTIRALDLEIAARSHVDFVSFSNPLPVWLHVSEFPYAAIARRLETKIVSYLDRRSAVRPAFRIQVPYNHSTRRAWLVPSTNDQIALHACARHLARSLLAGLAVNREVFSYVTVPDGADVMGQQLEQWLAFTEAIENNLRTHEFILQFDIRNAFASIKRPGFYAFLRGSAPNGDIADLIELLIDGWSGSDPGVPLVNDSLFFLGNAYLGIVDDVVRRHSGDFVRFVDDYRIFGTSSAALETLYEDISRDLSRIGFEINERKTRLGSGGDYLREIAKTKRSEDAGDEYLGPLLFRDVIDPAQLIRLVRIAMDEPESYLNVRFGRLLLREIRKFRTNAFSGSALHDQFVDRLSADLDLRLKIRELMMLYLTEPAEAWRLVWLLYLVEDLSAVQSGESEERRLVEAIARAPRLSPVVRLWASRILAGGAGKPAANEIFALQELDYVQQGRKLYGRAIK